MSKHYNLSYLMGKSLRAMASVIIIDSSRVCSATLTHGVKFYVWLSVYMSDCMNCPCHDLQSWQKENTIFFSRCVGTTQQIQHILLPNPNFPIPSWII